MEWQASLFDDQPPFAPCDPTVPVAARPRLSRQCQAIVDRLRRGPATNAELSAIALKYTSRISDIRKAGYAIECTPVDVVLGIYTYELEGANGDVSKR